MDWKKTAHSSLTCLAAVALLALLPACGGGGSSSAVANPSLPVLNPKLYISTLTAGPIPIPPSQSRWLVKQWVFTPTVPNELVTHVIFEGQWQNVGNAGTLRYAILLPNAGGVDVEVLQGEIVQMGTSFTAKDFRFSAPLADHVNYGVVTASTWQLPSTKYTFQLIADTAVNVGWNGSMTNLKVKVASMPVEVDPDSLNFQ